MIRRRESWLLVAICLAIVWFHVWTVRSNGDPWKFGQEQRDYYNLLIDGWLDGQLHLKVEPPAALLALPDPYDPRQRPAGLALHDASLFRGKYYLYFGAGPAVTLMLPFRLLTGTDLPLAVAVLIFVCGGFLAGVAMLLAIRRRYFPETSATATALCVLAFGLAGLGPVLLRRPHMWELPIAAGHCFAMLGLVGVWCALHGRGGGARVESARSRSRLHRSRWFAATGLSLGLAIASRPTYLVAAALLLVPPLIFWWRGERRIPWREALAAGLPLAVVGALMAWHNHARFGDPLQFGQVYQLSSDYEGRVQHFSARHIGFNAWRYFFSGAEWSRYFPFIAPVDLPAGAPRAAHEHVYGILTHLWFAWFAFAAPLAGWRRSSEERARIFAWLGSAGGAFAGVTLLLLCFFGSVPRYMFEFTPLLMLLAGVGVFALERWLGSWSRAGGRGIVRLAWATAAIASCGFAVIFSLQVNGFFAERNPQGSAAVARSLNRVPAWMERALGVTHGPWEMEVVFPREPAAQMETLLTLGDPPDVNRVFVRYGEAGRIQLGFARGAMPAVESVPLAPDRERPHRVRIFLGGFWPAFAHPWFADLTEEQRRHVARLVRIELDGRPVLQAYRRFDDSAGARVRVGAKALGDERHPRFSGGLPNVHRVAMPAAEIARLHERHPLHAAGDVLALRLTFPRDRVGGPPEPLVVSGGTGRGDVFGVEYVDAERVRFVFDHWGSAPRRSDPVAVDYSRPHELVVRLPWLAPVGAPEPERRGSLHVELDGATVWRLEATGYTAEPEEIAVGENPIGGNHPGVKFSGEILRVGRTAAN